MKAANIILKVTIALAAVAGAVYVIAAYGDKIVAWAKKLLGSCPCHGACKEDECVCEESDCCPEGERCCDQAPAEETVPAEEAPAEEAAAEEPVAEEAVAEEDFEA